MVGRSVCPASASPSRFTAHERRSRLATISSSVGVDVPTLKGSEHLEIPPGTQHGEGFKLKGKGLPDLRSTRNGDELVQIVDADEASILVGQRVAGPGWWLPSAGWADPAQVCRADLTTARCTFGCRSGGSGPDRAPHARRQFGYKFGRIANARVAQSTRAFGKSLKETRR